ncbi:hypothetical protein [Legionella sp. MW5194]|uniref:hypothetical protein n=1 Tax=Legionella sp. MW5194 TaxID=2662448 RepID=UPI00193E2ECF|nr:hypothetical protein [Legionella sp. MW5194]
MYVIALCGPIGANLDQLAKEISKAIQSSKVEIVMEETIQQGDGDYVVTDLIEKLQQEQGVLLLVGHFFLRNNALEKAFISALASKSKEEAESHPQTKEALKTDVINLKLFLETDPDTCYAHYLQKTMHEKKNSGNLDEKKGTVDTTENLAAILQINHQYEKCVKPINDEIINPSQKNAHVRVHDSANHAVICSLIHSVVNRVPVNSVPDEKHKPEPEPIGPRFFS